MKTNENKNQKECLSDKDLQKVTGGTYVTDEDRAACASMSSDYDCESVPDCDWHDTLGFKGECVPDEDWINSERG